MTEITYNGNPITTVIFDLDSATVNAWADTSDVSRGLRLSSTTADAGEPGCSAR